MTVWVLVVRKRPAAALTGRDIGYVAARGRFAAGIGFSVWEAF